jgi:hypothetical protein
MTKPMDEIRKKFDVLSKVLDERQLRLWIALEAEALGWGGVASVVEATGLWNKRIIAGKRDLEELRASPPTEDPHEQRIRRVGGGRKRLEVQDPQLLGALDALIDPSTRGDPQSPLRWTCKSLRQLSAELAEQGHTASPATIGTLLASQGYSLQSNRKVREGAQHPDRNSQFEHISRRARRFHAAGEPVISVDTKKKELIGDFKNGGREWQPQGSPIPVRVHDFLDKELGKAIPYGVYDVMRNEGWVSIGVNHDTSEFAVESIRRWWKRMGARAYPDARELLITADGGGSNGSRTRLWKTELQRFADETGLKLSVSHYPPGTSKWNKIEHRMFCHITQNWRGRPLESLEAVVNLIGATTTTTGLRIKAAADTRHYEKGIVIDDDLFAEVQLRPHHFHGEWNYRILPNCQA